jgi:hypothetical protein
MRSRQVRRLCSKLQEDKGMQKEDVVVLTAVVIATAASIWYVAQAVAGIVHPIPTDDTCTTVTQCLTLILG